ncbi:phakinin [Ornithorhynchus anatinus]|uniref:phakinin n=1 Tax=Ornithorhynchus anatinus TaxID=9258 RepID=UPI0010A8E919|nr:phakinin [Ornithorhynchus anatinus]
MPFPRRRSSFLGSQASCSSSTLETPGAASRRISVGAGGGGGLPRAPGVYVGTAPAGGLSRLGTRVSRRALGISSVFLQGLRSWSPAATPLTPGLEKSRGPSFEALNGCMLEYIEKVRALEQVNRELEEHLRGHLEKKASTVGNWGALRDTWENIYHQVGEAVLENARLMLQTENIQACAEDFKERYENEQPFRKAAEDEINSLYKVIDDANLTKTDLESQIESMKEELAFLSRNHEEEVKVLYKQLAGSELEEAGAPIGTGLVDILEAIRVHWEKDIEKEREEARALLHAKHQTEAAQAVRSKEEELVDSLRAEFRDTTCKIQSLQAETESLRTLKRGLENSLYDAKHWHDIELQNLGSVITKLETELGEIRVEIEQQQRDRENLLSSKIQLEKDIVSYHCLLDVEGSS